MHTLFPEGEGCYKTSFAAGEHLTIETMKTVIGIFGIGSSSRPPFFALFSRPVLFIPSLSLAATVVSSAKEEFFSQLIFQISFQMIKSTNCYYSERQVVIAAMPCAPVAQVDV